MPLSPETDTRRPRRYTDRRDAGRHLARALTPLAGARPLVLALPRGGVPVAHEVACALHAPLDVLFVRKLAAPGSPELGLGAIVDGADPQLVFNDDIVRALRPSPAYIEAERDRQLELIEQRKRRWRLTRPAEPVGGRLVILVDDGVATGGTARAALQALARNGARRVVLAVPVAPADARARLGLAPEDFVCPLQLRHLGAVGEYYDDFEQTTDEEVVALLHAAQQRQGALPTGCGDGGGARQP